MDKRERNDIFRVLDEETLKNSKKDVRSRSFLFPKRILWTAGQVELSLIHISPHRQRMAIMIMMI